MTSAVADRTYTFNELRDRVALDPAILRWLLHTERSMRPLYLGLRPYYTEAHVTMINAHVARKDPGGRFRARPRRPGRPRTDGQ